jgi:hypothetical protein
MRQTSPSDASAPLEANVRPRRDDREGGILAMEGIPARFPADKLIGCLLGAVAVTSTVLLVHR